MYIIFSGFTVDKINNSEGTRTLKNILVKIEEWK